MIDPIRMRELLDACRPGHDDLSLPEMAEARETLRDDDSARRLLAEIQRHDAVIAKAWRDVEVPDGLEDRILAALSSGESSSRMGDSPLGDSPLQLGDRATIGTEVILSESLGLEPEDEDRLAVVPTTRSANSRAEDMPTESRAGLPVAERDTRSRWPISRRWVMSVVVTAAGLLIVGALWWQRPQPLTLQGLSDLSRGLADDLASQDDSGALDDSAWKPFSPKDFPALRWAPARWREVSTAWDRHAIVFDFPLRDGSRLFLLQFHVDNSFDLPPVPYQVLGGTGLWKVGAWHEGGVLHVAVTNHGRILESFRAPFRAT